MSLLTIIQNAARALNIAVPTTVIGNSDLNTALLLRLAQQEGEDLSRRHDWQGLVTERTFTTLATVIQTACLPADYDRMIYAPELWNRTLNLKYAGPTPSRTWQQIQALTSGGITGWWRLLGGEVNIYPAPTAGETLAFEYVSKNFIDIAALGAPKATWSIDTDVGRIPERLLTLGIIWRWLAAKAMGYAEEMSTYERAVELACSRDRSAGVIRPPVDSDYPHNWPGTITP